MAEACYNCGRDTSKFPASKFITCDRCQKYVCLKCQDYKGIVCKSCFKEMKKR